VVLEGIHLGCCTELKGGVWLALLLGRESSLLFSIYVGVAKKVLRILSKYHVL